MLGKVDNGNFTHGDFIYSVAAAKIIITGYTGSGTSLNIQESFKDCTDCTGESGWPIAAIGHNAFANNKTITEVVLPDSVTKIGMGAFSNCSKLESINLDKVEVIADSAFYNCKSLKHTNFNLAGIISIGSQAFMGCSSLKEVPLGTSLQSVGFLAFAECNNLTKFSMQNGNTYTEHNFDVDANGVLLYGTSILIYPAGKEAISYKTSAGIQDIAAGAFYKNNKLKEVTLLDVTEIDAQAFCGCDNLEVVNAPNTYTISEYAFKNCKKLKKVLAQQADIGTGAFMNCKSLDQLGLLGINSISDFAFSGCCSLQEVDISNVNTIGAGAFYNCTSLKNLYKGVPVGDNALKVTEIKAKAFYNCKSLKANLGVMKNLKKIGDFAFAYTNIINLQIPLNLNSIGKAAFFACPIESIKLSEFVKDQLNSYFTIVNGGLLTADKKELILFPAKSSSDSVDFTTVTKIAPYAFAGSWVRVVNIPKIIKIGDYAFYNCTRLFTVTLLLNPSQRNAFSNIECIGASSFENCLNLGSVVFFGTAGGAILQLPNFTQIGDRAFKNCTKLRNFRYLRNVNDYQTILNSSKVIRIGAEAFYNCATIATLRLVNATTLGAKALWHCASLNDIQFGALDYIEGPPFIGCSNLAKITLAADSIYLAGNQNEAIFIQNDQNNLELVAFAPGYPAWDDRVTYEIPPTTVKVHGAAFYGCQKVDKLKLSGIQLVDSFYDKDSQTHFGAFANFKQELELDLGSNELTNLGHCAFQNTVINKPSGTAELSFSKLRLIGDYAFDNAINSLDKVTATKCDWLGKDAFRGTKDTFKFNDNPIKSFVNKIPLK